MLFHIEFHIVINLLFTSICRFVLSHKYISIKYTFFYYVYNVTINLALSPSKFTYNVILYTILYSIDQIRTLADVLEKG